LRRLALAVAALALAGCGGNDEAADPSATATADRQASLTVAATVAETATATEAATVAATDAETEQPAPPPERDPFAVGAVDDAVRTPGPTLAQLAAAGFGAVGITSYWEPGLSAPSAAERATLRSVARRAAERRLRVFLSVFQRGSATTPLTPEERADFADYLAAQRRVDGIWKEAAQWQTMAIRNTANVAWFSADRTVTEYAQEIWGVPTT
jgi:hypothetical protein